MPDIKTLEIAQQYLREVGIEPSGPQHLQVRQALEIGIARNRVAEHGLASLGRRLALDPMALSTGTAKALVENGGGL